MSKHKPGESKRTSPAERVQHARPGKTAEQLSLERARRRASSPDGARAERLKALGHPPSQPASHAPSEPSLPPEPVDAWPPRGACCWPTSDGRPWAFCGAPMAEGHASYCAEHAARAMGKAPPRSGPGAIEAQDFRMPALGGVRGAAAQPYRAALNGAKSAQAGARARGKTP